MKYNDYPENLPDNIIRKMAMEYNKANVLSAQEEDKTKAIINKLHEVEGYMLALANNTGRRFVREKFLDRITKVKEEKNQLIDFAKIQSFNFPPHNIPRFNSFNNCYRGYLCCEMSLIRKLIECCCSRFCNPALICDILLNHTNFVDCYFKNEF